MSINVSLQARRVAAIPRGVATAYPVFAERAESSELWDSDGKRYIDFAAGIAVVNTGHRHPKVIAAVKKQLEAFTHTAYQIVPYEPYIERCERLNKIAPFTGEAKSILFSTGAEAVENAIKVARPTPGDQRDRLLRLFHGRTIMTTALTGKVAPYKKSFGPMMPRCLARAVPRSALRRHHRGFAKCLTYLFRADVDPVHVAAIIIEPMQGEGGFHPAPVELMRGLRKVCDEHGILLIADEVQTGFARTGKMFGIEHSGVEPDMITIAKSLAGGFPLSAVTGKATIMDTVDPGGLGGTYAGCPLACAAALAVLDVIEEERLVERANKLGEHTGATGKGCAAQRHARDGRHPGPGRDGRLRPGEVDAAARSRTPTPPSGSRTPRSPRGWCCSPAACTPTRSAS